MIQDIDKLRPHQYIDVTLTDCFWHIMARPSYCDRGRYLWHCWSKDDVVLTIDGADGFPRYFFSAEALRMEMEEWCKARKQEMISTIGIQGIE